MSASPPKWDCRWPDPVAVKVAADRILQNRAPTDPTLNRKITISVQIELPKTPGNVPIRALLATPWGVERIYWSDPPQESPPVQHVAPLAVDINGLVAAGIGLLLESEGNLVPVLTAWEPEVGHHFVETILHSVHPFSTAAEAIAVALGNASPAPHKRTIADHLNHKVSRRKLLAFFRD